MSITMEEKFKINMNIGSEVNEVEPVLISSSSKTRRISNYVKRKRKGLVLIQMNCTEQKNFEKKKGFILCLTELWQLVAGFS